MRLAAWLLGLASTALCVASFDVHSDGLILGNDVVPYAQALSSGDWSTVLNPHHPLFHVLAAALTWLQGLFSEQAPLLIALRAQCWVASIGAGVASAWIVRSAAGYCGVLRAALIGALFACTAGTWLYGAVGETYLPASAALAGLLGTALEMRGGSRKLHCTPLCAWLLAAVLLRQDSVLVIPALLLLLPSRTTLSAIGLAGGACLALNALVWLSLEDVPAFGPWLRGLADSGLWGAVPNMRSLTYAAGTTAMAFAWVSILLKSEATMSLGILGLWCLGLMLLPLFPSRSLRQGAWVPVAALLVFALTRWLFFAWWQPANMEYHAGTWLPLLLSVALLLNPQVSGWRALRQPLLLGASLWLLAYMNFAMLIAPNRGASMHRRACLALEAAGDQGLVLALDRLQFYALMRAQADPTAGPGVALVDASDLMNGSLAEAPRAAFAQALRARIQSCLAAKHSVLLIGDRILPERLRVAPWPIDEQVVASWAEGAVTVELVEDGQTWAFLLRGRS